MLAKYVLAVFFLLATSIGAAPQTGSQKSAAQLNSEINSLFPDNTSGLITPFSLRQTTLDMVASSVPSFTSFIDVATASTPILCNGADQSSNLNALLTSLQSAGTGATLVFHACTYLFNSAIILPNDASVAAPHQVAIVFQGAGSQWSGETGAYPGRATVLDIRTSNVSGHIQTYGIGNLTIRDMLITDGGASGGNPFIYTTNTTLHFYHNTVIGNASFTGLTNDQDAIILGGTSTVISGAAASPFQGYGTIISENQFDRIRRLAYCRVYCNGVVIEKNWIERNSGNPLANGAVIELDGTGAGGAPGNFAVSNNIIGNIVEISNYSYFVNNLVGEYTTVAFNSLFDPTATTLGGVLNSAASVNPFVIGNLLTGKPFVAGTTSTITFIGQAQDGVPSTFPAGVGPLTVNGNLTSTGILTLLGTAGSDNKLSLKQSGSNTGTFEADGSNVVFRNTGAGSLFFDSASAGGIMVFRSGAGFTNVLDYNNTTANTWVSSKPFIASDLQTKTIYSAAGTAVPTCNAAAEGRRVSVSDTTAPTYHSVYTSGGAVHGPLYCDGTNWLND